MKRGTVIDNIGLDFNTNIQKSIRETIHSIEGFKVGYLSNIDFNNFKNDNFRRNPDTKDIFERVVPPTDQTKEYAKDDLVVRFSRYAQTVFQEYVKTSTEDEALVEKGETLSMYINDFDTNGLSGFRNDASLTLEVIMFVPDKTFEDKFGNITEFMKVKFMFENQIKDSERIYKYEKKSHEVVL